jgi:SSS family solute:Na+ symporter
MHPIDWYIIVSFIIFITALAIYTQRFTRSVADFLAANRCAGRYLLATAENMAMIGTVSILAMFEMYYYGGFGAVWWGLLFLPTGLVIALSGWVMYRFRQTRALTLAQFFEMRYSKNFRIFAGILMFVCGTLNFGIFPAVGARFFIYFCGLGTTTSVLGLHVATLPLVMGVLLGISVIFILLGGQIAVMVTDFVQGVFSNIIYVILALFLIGAFKWSTITEAYTSSPEGITLTNPFVKAESFNVWFFLISVLTGMYGSNAWQGTQGFNSSARTPHEARMGKILGNWRANTQTVVFVLLPVCAYALMHHSSFADKASAVNQALSGIDNAQLRKQMLVPAAMAAFVPPGLMGALCAVMFAGFISVHESYLHSWASIFVQDVVLPIRKKPLETHQHLFLLRCAISGVAVFIFCWSLFFKQTDYILMYMFLTGAIYLGGAGSVIIGGLYWKKGSVAAAFASMITGAVIATAGIIVKQVKPDFFLDGQLIMFVAMLGSVCVYVLVSLGSKTEFNMDQLLHRGQYAVKDDTAIANDSSAIDESSIWNKWMSRLGLTNEFTGSDRIVYLASIIWGILWSAVFIAGIIYNAVRPISNPAWMRFWYIWVVFGIGVSIVVTIWLTVGGLIDLKKLFALLSRIERNNSDDGTVVSGKPEEIPSSEDKSAFESSVHK